MDDKICNNFREFSRNTRKRNGQLRLYLLTTKKLINLQSQQSPSNLSALLNLKKYNFIIYSLNIIRFVAVETSSSSVSGTQKSIVAPVESHILSNLKINKILTF